MCKSTQLLVRSEDDATIDEKFKAVGKMEYLIRFMICCIIFARSLGSFAFRTLPGMDPRRPIRILMNKKPDKTLEYSFSLQEDQQTTQNETSELENLISSWCFDANIDMEDFDSYHETFGKTIQNLESLIDSFVNQFTPIVQEDLSGKEKKIILKQLTSFLSSDTKKVEIIALSIVLLDERTTILENERTSILETVHTSAIAKQTVLCLADEDQDTHTFYKFQKTVKKQDKIDILIDCLYDNINGLEQVVLDLLEPTVTEPDGTRLDILKLLSQSTKDPKPKKEKQKGVKAKIKKTNDDENDERDKVRLYKNNMDTSKSGDTLGEYLAQDDLNLNIELFQLNCQIRKDTHSTDYKLVLALDKSVIFCLNFLLSLPDSDDLFTGFASLEKSSFAAFRSVVMPSLLSFTIPCLYESEFSFFKQKDRLKEFSMKLEWKTTISKSNSIIESSLAKSVSKLVAIITNGLVETKERVALIKRVYANLGEYSATTLSAFGYKHFLQDETTFMFKSKVQSIPFIVDTARVGIADDTIGSEEGISGDSSDDDEMTIKANLDDDNSSTSSAKENMKDKIRDIKVTRRGKGEETNFSSYVSIDPVTGKKELKIYRLDNNSFIVCPKEVQKDGKTKTKPIGTLPLPREFDLENSMIMLKDGLITKRDNGKFLVHLCVSIRKKLFPPPSRNLISPRESLKPLLSDSKKKYYRPNGFYPFLYEEGRGLPTELATITNFGLNILWRKNPSFKSDPTRQFLGVISLDPGIKTF